MAGLPIMALFSAWGYAFNGVLGLAMGATIGFMAAMAGRYVNEGRIADRAKATSQQAADTRAELALLNRNVGSMRKLMSAVLDGQPTLHHDLLFMNTPRTQAEWEAISPLLWPLIHRKLVIDYGLPAKRVNAAEQVLLNAHMTRHRLPATPEELDKLIDEFDRAERWAREPNSRFSIQP